MHFDQRFQDEGI